MRKWIKELLFERVSTKLITMVLLLLILCATFISTSYFGSTVSIIGNQVRASTQQGAKQTADYLSLILTVGTDMGQQIFRNSRLQEAVDREIQGDLTVDEKFAILGTVGQTLNNSIYTSSFVRSIYILKERGDSWGSGSFNASKVKRYTLSSHQWYSDVANDRTNELWLPLNYDPFSGGGENTDLVLTHVEPFRNLKTRETEGVISVNLDGKLILDAIQRIKLGKTGTFFVVNSEGTVMIHPDPNTCGKPLANEAIRTKLLKQKTEEQEFEMSIGGMNHYFISHKMNNGWMLVGQVPVSEIIGDIQTLQHKITVYTVLFLFFALLIGFLFSNRITKPMKELAVQMKEIEKSNFQARSRIRSRDELGRLGLSFNHMADKIESLIDEVNEAGAKKREAEIRVLMHQINPHFLYNTLSTIRWMIKLHNYDGAYKGIASLVELMEASMGKKGMFSTLRHELDLIQKYMIIQRFRYGPILHLQIEAEESLLDIRIPRMLLQPIVENAIFHGLAPKSDGGTISLKLVYSEWPSTLLIVIKDDGIGISEDKIRSLLQTRNSSNSGMFGIGLYHVHETLQLYYGHESGVSIESEPGQGTTIQLKLVWKEEIAYGL